MDATTQLHDALSVIEDYGGAIEADSEVKMAAMRYGVDFTIEPSNMIHELGRRSERLAAVVVELATSSDESDWWGLRAKAEHVVERMNG